MFIILIYFLIISILALGSFYRYLGRNKVFFFLMLEDKTKAKVFFVVKTLIFSLFYSENQVQKKTLACFKKLGKLKFIGRDGWGNIFIRFAFPNKETCLFLIPRRDNWRMIQGGGRLPKLFMESFNVGWYGKVEDLEKAVKRGPIGNFLQNL